MDKQILNVENNLRSRRGYYDYDSPHEFEVTVQPFTSVLYKIKLFGPIEDVSQFSSALEAFERASEDDRVIIHLSTPGGNLDATDTFLHAMRRCPAPVHVIASGGVHSAGTVILLNAPSFSLSENFNCLIHNGAVGPGGKFSDWRAAAKYTDAYMDQLMRKTYWGFLTEQEVEDLIAGKDFWFDGKEFVQRYERRNELLKEQHGDNGENNLEAFLDMIEDSKGAFEETPPPSPKPKRKPRKKTT